MYSIQIPAQISKVHRRKSKLRESLRAARRSLRLGFLWWTSNPPGAARVDLAYLTRNLSTSPTRWRKEPDSNSRIWTQPRSQAARSIKVKPVAFVYTASVRSSVICSGHDGIRAPRPDRYYGLEGQRVRQVCKTPVRPVTHHR